MSVLSKNPRANYDYAIEETVLAGLALTGTEVKSIRGGRASIKGTYCNFNKGELWLVGAFIPEFSNAQNNHDPDRNRKLLLQARELKNLQAKKQNGNSIVPIKIQTKGNFIKLLIGIGKPKKQYDKRQSLQKKDDARRKNQAIKRSGRQ
ncbi:TPA: SsrA-binding protein SmpB [Candidatus Saccharibacteria bacterium]|nr:SsrA-binding protein SmpB [Candidatus Saccharibacteria bacterium]HIO87682.1 SsrA-binding protein SmpB [Candidatus Saccharibacteria bacterium]